MADKQPNPSFAFVTDYLTKNPTASFAEVRDAAARRNFKIYPIVYGRAQAMLGLVESKPRGQGKMALASRAARSKRASAEAPRSEPTRAAERRPVDAARSNPIASGNASIDSIIAHIRGVERERDELRAALAKIREAVEGMA